MKVDEGNNVEQTDTHEVDGSPQGEGGDEVKCEAPRKRKRVVVAGEEGPGPEMSSSIKAANIVRLDSMTN